MTEALPPPPGSPLALCLGGFDPSAGAGLLRDVMTLASLGVHPMAICTAMTVQNGEGCRSILAPADPLDGLRALEPHLRGAWGVKLGLSALTPDGFRALAAGVAALDPRVRIWDPILAPTAGVGLHAPAELRTMAATLLATGGWVVSPNLPEAAALAGLPWEAGPAELASPLLELGATAVWLKGGHSGAGAVEDLWITREGVLSLGRSPRLAGDRRGTGCTLASLWLGLRLRGLEGPAAAVEAATLLRSRWLPEFRPGDYGRPCFAPVPA